MSPKTIIIFTLCMFVSAVIFAADDRGIRRKKKTAAQSENRVALVIGNGNYESSPLRNPVNDVRAMSETLGKLGFEVTKQENLGFQEMSEAIALFGEKLLQGGVGLFYYAGHGIQYNGKNYLIPIGSGIQHEKQVKYRAVDAGSVLAEMDNARNRMNIVILDACRDNPFARSFRTGGKGLVSMDAPVGSMIAYATAPGKTASDGSGKNGLYTSELIREMQKPDMRLVDVFDNTRRAVRKQTGGKQIPWESRALEGAFYFAGGSSEVIRPRPQEPSLGRLSLETSPSGAAIYIGGKNMGNTPLLFGKLKPGRYEIRAEMDGYRAEEKTVTIGKGEDAKVTLYLDEIVTTTTTRPAPAATTTTLPARAKEWREPVTGMEFVYVKGGCYEMGCGSWTSSCNGDEKPVHTVCLDDFYMGKYEVTQGEWKRVMGNDLSRFKKGDNHPVEEVSWSDAKEFIRKLNAEKRGQYEFRLPSEAEWEYACRSGGKAEKYSGGSNADRVAWHDEEYSGGHHAVGTKAPNGLGIYDMSGNIYEWCEDIYDREAYSKHRRNNPIYADGGSDRVDRGGSWSSDPAGVRCAERSYYSPAYRFHDLGIRLVRTP
ncbi:SUMF1/EgtB/PvdO family nonheme iron enzyme [Desulfococcaceae bacterium HSG8]|nr:SUMF1/EgtB/PvdO family nonheme iron enzyme [Desulfococcaceae bacterium HSG8]